MRTNSTKLFPIGTLVRSSRAGERKSIERTIPIRRFGESLRRNSTFHFSPPFDVYPRCSTARLEQLSSTLRIPLEKKRRFHAVCVSKKTSREASLSTQYFQIFLPNSSCYHDALRAGRCRGLTSRNLIWKRMEGAGGKKRSVWGEGGKEIGFRYIQIFIFRTLCLSSVCPKYRETKVGKYMFFYISFFPPR